MTRWHVVRKKENVADRSGNKKSPVAAATASPNTVEARNGTAVIDHGRAKVSRKNTSTLGEKVEVSEVGVSAKVHSDHPLSQAADCGVRTTRKKEKERRKIVNRRCLFVNALFAAQGLSRRCSRVRYAVLRSGGGFFCLDWSMR
jgi:hypothetical protein